MTTAAYRYGVVFVLAFALLVFVVVAPSADWARAIALALEGAALIVVVATSRARERVRRVRAIAVGVVALVIVVATAVGALSAGTAFLLAGLLATFVAIALVRGLLRLVHEQGVTLQAVAGALAIYLLIGLWFAWLIGFVAHTANAAYFTNGTDGTDGDRIYFSFTVLTTTGFGDFTAATASGQALAVVEMLIGQLYLVTVIGVLIGSFVRRRQA